MHCIMNASHTYVAYESPKYMNSSWFAFEQGYKMKDAFIATQGPLQNTVVDFWRMIWENKCGCIVMLCELEEDGQVYQYF